MSTQNKIYYFLIGNVNTRKEIGSYINPDIEISNSLLIKCNEIFNDKGLKNERNSKFNINTKIFKNFRIFYAVHPSNTFYLLASDERNKVKNESIVEIFKDIENHGIKILVGEDGKLSSIGKKNLKFCIEQESRAINNKFNEESNKNEQEKKNKKEKEKEENNENEIEENNEKEEVKEKDSNSLLNKTPIDIKNEIKKNFGEVNGRDYLTKRNVEISDNSQKYENDYNDRKIRIYKWMKISYIFSGVLIGIVVVYIIFFR